MLTVSVCCDIHSFTMISLSIVFISFCDVLDKCDASTDDWSCCKDNRPCDEGEGACHYDSQCAGSLVCGKWNCKDYDSAWSSNQLNCCMKLEGKKII